MSIRTAAAAFVTLTLCTSVAFAQDWPQWRGPHRDGITTGFVAPGVWPSALTQTWKVTIGLGDATPALVGDRLFVFGRVGTDEKIQCLNASNGTQIWEDLYPADYLVTGPPKDHGGPRSSVAVANGKVVTLGVGGILSCVDSHTGKVLWRKQSRADYAGVDYKSDSSMSPLLTDGLCIVHIGKKEEGRIFALSLEDGSIKWSYDQPQPTSSSPVLMTVAGTKQLLFVTAEDLLSLSLYHGTKLWSTEFEAERGNNTTPIVSGSTVIMAGQGKGIVAFAVTKQDDRFSVEQVWINDAAQLGPRFTTPVQVDNLLFGYGRKLYCFDTQTQTIAWEGPESLGNSASLVYAPPVMMGLGVKGDLVVFRANAAQYTELARYKVADTDTWAHPIVAGNRIFVRDKDSVALWIVK
ncbi:MAG: PQQ-like beta-propeller repeat protein [Phycisphaerae bacterium]|nr:PQQ-like beta-propeller repeat protein [Phycisphaerae bacterium]